MPYDFFVMNVTPLTAAGEAQNLIHVESQSPPLRRRAEAFF
jgi:hypothetical protein